jgi:hypothetical protein
VAAVAVANRLKGRTVTNQGGHAGFALFTADNWQDWTTTATATSFMHTQVCALPAAAVCWA